MTAAAIPADRGLDASVERVDDVNLHEREVRSRDGVAAAGAV
jgi:hypothetical protein